MAWENLLKALPKPANVAGFLTTDKGADYILGEAEKEDKKNIIRVKNKVTALSQKKQIPTEFKEQEDAIAAEALKVVEGLNKILTADKQKAKEKYTVAFKFDEILQSLKEGDKEPLQKFVGKGFRTWSSNTRQRKMDVLSNHKSELLELIDEDDDELLYYTTDKEYRTKQVGAMKEIQEAFKEYNVTVEKIGSEIVITLGKAKIENGPLVITPTHLEQVKDIINKFEQRSTGNQIKFTRTGGASKSVLLKLLGKADVSDRVQRERESIDSNSYTNKVESEEDALNYLKLLGSKGWRKKVEFMPTPKTKSKKAIENARQSLLMVKGKVGVSATLETILTSGTLDLRNVVERGEEVKTKRKVSSQLVALFEKAKDKQSEYYTRDDRAESYDRGEGGKRDSYVKTHPSGVAPEKIKELRNIYRKRGEEFPKFYTYVMNSSSDEARAVVDDLQNLEKYYQGEQQGTNLFTKEEVDLFEKLPEIIKTARNDVAAVNNELKEFYGKGNNRMAISIVSLLEGRKTDEPMFKPVKDMYKFNHLGVSMEKAKIFVSQLKNFRDADDGIDISMTKTNTLNTLLDEFEEYDENLHDVTPSSILHTIIKLDYYYGSRKLNGMKNRILDEDVEKKQLDMLKELIKLAEKNQDDIVQGLVDAVKEKVQHIIDNSSVYIELLEYEKKGEVIQDQMYTLMGRLEKKDLVEVTQDGD